MGSLGINQFPRRYFKLIVLLSIYKVLLSTLKLSQPTDWTCL